MKTATSTSSAPSPAPATSETSLISAADATPAAKTAETSGTWPTASSTEVRAVTADAAAGTPKTAEKARPRILLVDDLPANLVALTAQLEQLDCEIDCRSSGNDALKALLKTEYAVVLLDVQMPEMDGYEVARYARDNPTTKDVPIIFLTATNETEDGLVRGYGSGAVDYLFKPININILRSKVQVFLDLYANQRRLADEVAAHERTMADLEAFNYSVSHDLRAPLRPLTRYAEILLEEYAGDLDETAKTYLSRIRGAAVRMSDLIDDMLRLSRVRGTPIVRREVDLAELAGSIMGELRKAEPQRNVELVAAPTRAQADPALLRIALENLLRNAWKFTRRNESSRIELGSRTDRGVTVYFVKDDGAGFDPEYAEKLFKPFQRLHSESDFEGTGIGLAIVAQIIRNHGGRIWAEGVPQRGATFLFTLPSRGDLR